MKVGRRKRTRERREIYRIIRKMKDGKSMGVDGVPGEVWKYSGREMENWV